jgi:hypothetical protein
MSACDCSCVRACVRDSACVRAFDSARAHSILYALHAVVPALPRFRREGSLEYLNLRVCVCVHAFMCASVRLAPMHEVAEVTDEAEREAYERTYCTPRPISGGFVGRSATSAAPLRRVNMRSPAASAFALLEGPPRRGDEQAPIHCPAEGHAGLSTQAAPHCASGTKAAPPRPKRESAVSAANGWTPEVLGAGCGTMLGCACFAANVGSPSDRQASAALHEHRPRSAQRRRLRTIAAT